MPMSYSVKFTYSTGGHRVVMEWPEEKFAQMIENELARHDALEGRRWSEIMKIAFDGIRRQVIRELNAG